MQRDSNETRETWVGKKEEEGEGERERNRGRGDGDGKKWGWIKTERGRGEEGWKGYQKEPLCTKAPCVLNP